jgi:hypothetical protein
MPQQQHNKVKFIDREHLQRVAKLAIVPFYYNAE